MRARCALASVRSSVFNLTGKHEQLRTVVIQLKLDNWSSRQRTLPLQPQGGCWRPLPCVLGLHNADAVCNTAGFVTEPHLLGH
jgi:hypothetical protein